MATNIQKMIDFYENMLKEMAVRTEFKFEPVRMDYKAQEMYSHIYCDMIRPYYFAIIKESKYFDIPGDKYRASIDFQPRAYKVKDYNPHKAEVYAGIVRHFPDYKLCTKWLRDEIRNNFELALKENKELEETHDVENT